MRPFRLLLLLFSTLLLAGCGSYYHVSVDSLRDVQQPSGTRYLLVPGNEGVEESDLLFREVVRQMTPAFQSKGYSIVENEKDADNVAKVSYWMEEPRVRIDTSTVTRSYPVVVGRGKYRHVEYVYVDEPVVSSTTVYSANLLIEAYEGSSKQPLGRQVWRTALRCSGGTEDFRTLLFSITRVLPSVLGTESRGMQQYQVFLGEDGEIEVTNLRDSMF